MSGPGASVCAVRTALRRGVADLSASVGTCAPLVLVACSGGADSTALADAAAYLASTGAIRAGLITVDHGLQPGSAAQAEAVRRWAVGRGLDPVEVAVPQSADAAAVGGPEALARRRRYVALDEASERLGADTVLLGHTLDDQAESVLLGLARGSGARSLSGMAAVRGRYRRPLLGLRRATTEEACAQAGIEVWRDPQNGDDSFARVRIRAMLSDAEAAAAGITAGLARSARQLRDDADALDRLAARAASTMAGTAPGDFACAELAELDRAIRTRVLRRSLIDAGAPPGSLSAGHVEAVEALVTSWHGQGSPDLPGPVEVARLSGRLHIRRVRTAPDRTHMPKAGEGSA